MSIPATPSTPPSPDDRSHAAAEPVQPGFEEKMGIFWERNSRTILALCVVVLLIIVAKGAWEVMAERREAGIAADYAAAGNDAQLQSFADAHEGHALAGAAHLRLADTAYSESRYSEAAAGYEQALESLEDNALAGRVRLGLAMSRLQAGQTAEGEEALRALAEDDSELKAVRAEAAYHLARRAAESGRTEEVNSLSTLIMTIDPTSSWSQRAFMLREQSPLPVAAPVASEPAAEAPAVQFNLGK